jgi:hypothetical protein
MCFSHVILLYPFQPYAWLVGAQYKSTELLNSDWAVIRKSPPWAIDSWGLGKTLIVPFVCRRKCNNQFGTTRLIINYLLMFH